jgi:hypothetical protein
MKTTLTGKPLMFFAFVSIMMISCGKESNSFIPASGLPDTTPTVTTIGSVVDLGIINNDTRIMSTDLTTQSFTLYGTDDELSYVSGKVQLAFYVNADGVIPSGEYAFSNSEEKIPFTFDSGVFLLSGGGDSGGIPSDPIVNGNIIVTQDGDKYILALQVELASGTTFSERYNGSLAYTDSK